MKKLTFILALSAGLLTAAASGNAVTVSSVLVDGNLQASNNTLTGTLTGTGDLTATGSLSGDRRSPFDITDNNGDPREYLFSSNGGFIEFQLDSLSTALTFLWGSPDSYNSLELYNGLALISTIVPGNLVPATPPVIDALNTYLVTVLADNFLENFDRLIFRSGQPSFEFANVEVTPVPLPPALLLLLGGIAGIGALGRRKKKVEIV